MLDDQIGRINLKDILHGKSDFNNLRLIHRAIILFHECLPDDIIAALRHFRECRQSYGFILILENVEM